MEIKTIIESLRHCTISEGDCRSCPSYHHDSGCLDKLHVKAAATLESQQKQIAELEAQNRWIPVTERLPEKSGWYLVARNHHQMAINYSTEHRMFNCHDTFSAEEAAELHLDCTHWMPLPEPPKEVTR